MTATALLEAPRGRVTGFALPGSWTGAAGPASPSSYEAERTCTLDGNGNRITAGTTPYGQSQTLEVYTANSTNEYTQVAFGGTTRTYGYDGTGNRRTVSCGGQEWRYDYRNLLAEITIEDDEPYTEYLHDVLGRRMCKRWQWDEEGETYRKEEWHYYAGSALIQEYAFLDDDDIDLQAEYVWGRSLAEPVQIRRWDPGLQEFDAAGTFHQDASGSTLALTDGTTAAEIIESYRYLVHGGATIFGSDTSTPGAPFGNKFLWKAAYYDLEVIDVLSGQRLYDGTYDPLTGANIQRSATSPPAGPAAEPIPGNPGYSLWLPELPPQDIYIKPGLEMKGKKGGGMPPRPRPARGAGPGYGGPGERGVGGTTPSITCGMAMPFVPTLSEQPGSLALLGGIEPPFRVTASVWEELLGYGGLVLLNGRTYRIVFEAVPFDPSMDPCWNLYPAALQELLLREYVLTGRIWLEEAGVLFPGEQPGRVDVEIIPDDPPETDPYGRSVLDTAVAVLVWDSEDHWLINLAGYIPFCKLYKLGKAAFKAARGGTAAARQLGRAGEAAVRAAHDIGPRKAIKIGGRTRVPDGINRKAGTLSEVKNVQSLSFTSQLRDYVAFAQQEGLAFDLYVRPDTQLSGPLLDAIESGVINRRSIP